VELIMRYVQALERDLSLIAEEVEREINSVETIRPQD
jgi:hypothetical protein